MSKNEVWYKYYRLSILINGSIYGTEMSAKNLSHALEQELNYHMGYARGPERLPAQINISREVSKE